MYVSHAQAHLRGDPLPFPAPAIASISNAAVELNREQGRAEGELTKYWAAEYLRQRGGQGWPALVLGWFRAELNLAAVSLEDLGLETIVKVGTCREEEEVTATVCVCVV